VQTLHVSDEGALPAAVAALRAGEVIVVPTDTVYGLAALPEEAEAVRRVYLAKGRPGGMALPVLAASVDQVRQLGVDFGPDATRLAARWWPGPLTMAFGFSGSSWRPAWLAGRDEVAVRIPDQPFLLALIRTIGVVLVTSANPHGAPTPSSADEAGRLLAPHVPLGIDAGPLDSSPSTLINLRARPAVIEREGALSRSDLTTLLDPPA